jgi:4'-phosphopantetheinyl transferase EntD
MMSCPKAIPNRVGGQVRVSELIHEALAIGDARTTVMVEGLVPASACAQTAHDISEATMLPAEAAAIAHAASGRRREFATVRHCARQALRRIGMPPVPILPDADGVPRWPAGVVGSMTHCAGYRAAVVARPDRVRGIGIDAEPHAALPGPAPDLVLRDEERPLLRTMAEADPNLHWDRILFCAKEAAYKAWFPSTRRWLNFADISVTLRPEGTFRARILVADPRMPRAGRDGLEGRWAVDHGVVVAATSVTP